MWEPVGLDMDVAAIHLGYLRGLRECGGAVACGVDIRSINRFDGKWIVETARKDRFEGSFARGLDLHSHLKCLSYS